MSLASIRDKEGKGKRKTLPKLKTILANPYQSKCSSLNETEIENLYQILDAAICKSGLAPRNFAKINHICIGLEGVLRSINRRQVSCVFLSLSIKPHHVVQLVAQNVEAKCATAPVYAVSQLEKQTFKLFGLHGVAFSLPRTTEDLCTELKEWIDKHRKCVKVKQEKTHIIKKRTVRKQKRILITKEDTTVDKAEILNNISSEKSDWSGDFISFSSSSYSKKKVDSNLDQDKTKLLGVLSRMTEKNQINTMGENVEFKKMDVGGISEINEKRVSSIQNSDSDVSLEDYKPLKVHTILPNPEKKPKKKRRNKK